MRGGSRQIVERVLRLERGNSQLPRARLVVLPCGEAAPLGAHATGVSIYLPDNGRGDGPLKGGREP
jgi:hypothetical protein